MSETTTKAETKFTVDKVEITMGDGKSPYVPKNGGNFIDHAGILKTLAFSIKENLPVLLIGESGTGKTSAIRFLADKTQNGLRRVNLNGGTTADELVGRNMINDKGTYWVDGVLTEAMRNGEWIVLDEINAALPEVLFVLQSIMDDDGFLVLTEKDDKEIVHKHKDFRIFATCNPPEYAGTKEMNKALLSRFAVCINAEFPPTEEELKIIAHHLGDAVAQSEMATKLVDLANTTRNAKKLQTQDYAINTRDILNTLKLVDLMEPMDAVRHAFGNKLETEDREAFEGAARLIIPTSKKKANLSRAKITDTEELIIGQSYVLDGDAHGAFFGLGKYTEAEFDQVISEDLPKFIGNNRGNVETGIKGDEFTIVGTYYEDDGVGALKQESTLPIEERKLKAASAVKITAGANKGKKGVIIHHPAMGQSISIINVISKIS